MVQIKTSKQIIPAEKLAEKIYNKLNASDKNRVVTKLEQPQQVTFQGEEFKIGKIKAGTYNIGFYSVDDLRKKQFNIPKSEVK